MPHPVCSVCGYQGIESRPTIDKASFVNPGHCQLWLEPCFPLDSVCTCVLEQHTGGLGTSLPCEVDATLSSSWLPLPCGFELSSFVF